MIASIRSSTGVTLRAQQASRDEVRELARDVVVRGGEFLEKRRFRLPGQATHRTTEPEKVGSALDSELSVRLPGVPVTLPVRSVEDVRELSALHGGSEVSGLAEAELASTLKGLAGRGVRFFARLEGGKPVEVGLYGAYNALTGEHGISDLQVTVAGVRMPLDAPTAGELLAFSGELARLEEEGFHFFSAEGERLCAFQASRAEGATVGKGEPWLPVAEHQQLEAFEADLQELGSAALVRKAMGALPSHPPTDEEVLAFLERGADAAEQARLGRYALARREDDKARRLLELTEGRRADQIVTLLARGLAPGDLDVAILESLPHAEAVALAEPALAALDAPGARFALEAVRDGQGGYRLGQWDSIVSVYRAGLAHPDDARAAAREAFGSLREREASQDAALVAERWLEGQDPLWVTMTKSGDYRLTSWASVLDVYEAALAGRDPSAPVAAAFAAERWQDGALMAETLLEHFDTETCRLALSTARSGGQYRLEKWPSIAAVYQAALEDVKAPGLEFARRVPTEGLVVKDQATIAGALLETLDPEGFAEARSLVMQGEQFQMGGWRSIAVVYQQALEGHEGLELARRAFDEILATPDAYSPKDAGTLGCAALEAALENRETRDAAELALRAVKTGKEYHLQGWPAVHSCLRAALANPRARGPALATLAREGVAGAASDEDAVRAGRKFLEALRWVPETSEMAFFVDRLDKQGFSSWEGLASLFRAGFERPLARSCEELSAVAVRAAQGTENVEDRLLLARAALDQFEGVAPDLAAATRQAMEGAPAAEAARLALAALEVHALVDSGPAGTIVEEEHWVDVGGNVVQVRPESG